MTARATAGRLALLVVASAITLLVVEGVLSLAFRSSIRPKPAFIDLAERMQTQLQAGLDPADDREQFRVHPDPRVGFVLRSGSGFKILESTYSADEYGVRGRPGPPPPEDALRIAILGDSVAFSAGVNDDETLAARLEETLNAARGPSARPVACYTIAVTGWNHRNASAFLLDHFDHYRPDLVVYLPIDNDLTDTYGVFESGNRRVRADLLAEEPMLAVSDEPRFLFQYTLAQQVRSGELTDPARPDQLGPHALNADLTRESRRRYDDNAASIERLHDALEGRGVKLALFSYYEDAPGRGYTWVLRERLLGSLTTFAEIPGLVALDPRVTLPNDAHPNAAGHLAFARWIARWLLDAGWVEPGEGHPVPDAPDGIEALRAARRSPQEVRARAAGFRAESLARAQGRIDLRTGQGIEQVYGGLNLDGTIGPRFLAFLRGRGARLRVELEPLDPAPVPDVRVSIVIDGADWKTVTLDPATARQVAEVSLAEGDDDRVIEVALRARTWTARPVGPRLGIAAARLLSIEIVAE